MRKQKLIRSCPYCKSTRRTLPGLQEHIAGLHPGNITPSGILLPNKKFVKLVTEN
jgi:glutaredoxin